MEWPQVAAPTESNTPSTRSGSRAPDSKTRCAPSSRPVAAVSDLAVTHTRIPAATPSWISAVATPPAAPCTSMVDPGGQPGSGEDHPVGGQVGAAQVAASAAPIDAGRGSTFAAGTTQYSAIAP